jgi:hypothetical protein
MEANAAAEGDVPETKADVPETDVPETETPLGVEDVGGTLPVYMISLGDQDCPIVTSGGFEYDNVTDTVTSTGALDGNQVHRCNYAFGNHGAERCVEFINAPVVGLGENSVIVELHVLVDDDDNTIIGLFVRGEDLGWTIRKCHVTLINGVCDFRNGGYVLVSE